MSSDSAKKNVSENDLRGIFPTVTKHIKTVLLLKKLNINEININFLHYLIIILLLTFLSYISYLLAHLASINIVLIIKNLLFPTYIFIGFIFLIFYSFLAGQVYGNLLNSYKFKNYYVILLGASPLPIAILLGNIFSDVYFLIFFATGLISENFIRRTLSANVKFENKNDKYYFITVSFLLNLGMFSVIFPAFFLKN